MTLKDFVLSGSALFAAMTLVQISPIKVNPWTALRKLMTYICVGNMPTQMDGLSKQITKLDGKLERMQMEQEEHHAKSCRYRILRFADEIYMSTPHSKEHYDQILIDITYYERFCDSHPNFENNVAVEAIKQIKLSYREHLAEHTFLVGGEEDD